jgi:hypothetical protein
MNKMLKIKLGLPILAACIAIIASAFTMPAGHARFTGTSFFAQESATSAITYQVGTTFVTIPSSLTLITASVVTAGGITTYSTNHCQAGFTRTCIAQTNPKPSGLNAGKPQITAIFVGEFQ